MKMLIFDVSGKFASFKKFYTNSSSLSYIFPPRTVISGIIASIMGYEFDSYYELMNFKNSVISISLRSKIRTYKSTLNYMKIINSRFYNDIIKKGYEYTQIPFEILLPEDFSKNLVYRIYFASNNIESMQILKDKIKNHTPYYPISLGNVNMLANLNFVCESEIEYIDGQEQFIEVISPSPLEYISDIKMEENIHIQKDIMPVYFDDSRNPQTMRYIYEIDGKPYKIKTNKMIINLKYNGMNENMLLPEVATDGFLFA